MKFIKSVSIPPIHLQKNDAICLEYRYENTMHKVQLDTFETGTFIDTVLVYETEEEDFGMKVGSRIIILGESSNSHPN